MLLKRMPHSTQTSDPCERSCRNCTDEASSFATVQLTCMTAESGSELWIPESKLALLPPEGEAIEGLIPFFTVLERGGSPSDCHCAMSSRSDALVVEGGADAPAPASALSLLAPSGALGGWGREKSVSGDTTEPLIVMMCDVKDRGRGLVMRSDWADSFLFCLCLLFGLLLSEGWQGLLICL